MSITRKLGNIWFECDKCGGLLETKTDEWTEALEALKEEHWTSHKDRRDGTWEHYCESCSTG